ncbi:MAG: hypothetical protein Fur009_8030 [Candidatus Microgenomates bacterium]
MERIKKYLIFAFLLILFLIINNNINYFRIYGLEIKNDLEDNIELMSQGKIRTCLEPKFYGNPPGGSPAIQKTFIELNGFCESPTGCVCIRTQKINSNINALDEDKECEDFVNKYDICSASKEELKKERTKGNKIANKCTHCGHVRRDANDPLLQALKPIIEPCNLVKNLNENNSNINNQSVLGESNTLPYGPVKIVVSHDTARHAPDNFYLVGDLPNTEINLSPNPTVMNDNKSIKLGILNFGIKDFDIKNIEKKCISITWDPFGRVFDSQTLEPISDIEVVLIDDKTNQPVIQQFEDNFDITGNDGLFNILIEKEGYYKLEVNDYFTNHKLVNKPKINPLWKKIYSDIYEKDKKFYERVKIATHHDIPLVSTSDKPYKDSVVVVYPESLEVINLNNQIIYQGRVSFPFAKICLKNEEDNKIIGHCNNANKIGKFSIAISKKDIPLNKLLLLAFKVDLTNPKTYEQINSENSNELLHENSTMSIDQQKKIYFEPIFDYIEGYAYKNGEILKNAKVLVRLVINNNIFFETKTDETGYFKIETNNLPFLEYYFEYVNNNVESIIKKTSEFAKDNKNYLLKKNISLYIQQINNNSKKSLINYRNEKKISTNQTLNKITNNKTKIILIIFIIILLIIAIILIFIYYKKKSKFL